jgi:hypothetical protein
MKYRLYKWCYYEQPFCTKVYYTHLLLDIEKVECIHSIRGTLLDTSDGVIIKDLIADILQQSSLCSQRWDCIASSNTIEDLLTDHFDLFL